jgi:2-(1,2-epoxy-1,2-dihydrophenyl)acetyl-CoA isomerase
MFDGLLLERNESIASMVFDRPDRANALDVAWLPAMKNFLIEVDTDPGIRVVVLRGNGRHFMAGGDLQYLGKLAGQTPDQRATAAAGAIQGCNELIYTMRRLRKPIVAVVQGGVAGSAVGLVGACDLVIAADNAFFVLAHVALGLCNDGMSTYFLPRQLGPRKALELALLGDRLTAADAQAAGLVNFVVPAAELDAAAQKLATRLANGPTVAYGAIKKLMNASTTNAMEQQGALEAAQYELAARSDDFVEGIQAALQKRAAAFAGR